MPRYRTAESTWRCVLRWNEIAQMERTYGSCVAGSGRIGKAAKGSPQSWRMPGFWPVFPSLCDPLDNEVPDSWRDDFWELVRRTPNLTWLILTKRIGNASRMVPTGSGYEHLWLGASIVNQEEADRDLAKLREARAAVKFISHEPALGPVVWDLRGVDQLIVGGESDQGGVRARPFDLAWAELDVDQAREAGTAVFVKQIGSNPVRGGEPIRVKQRAGSDPAEWPIGIRVQEFPMRRTR